MYSIETPRDILAEQGNTGVESLEGAQTMRSTTLKSHEIHYIQIFITKL